MSVAQKEKKTMGTIIKNIETSSSTEVRLMISDENWLETSAVDQLKKTTELPGMCCGVGMPDLHPGKGQPIGAAFISKNIIYPHLVGSDIGCGMGVWKLDVSARKVKVDKWEKKLTGLDASWSGDCDEWLKNQGVIKPELRPELRPELKSDATLAVNTDVTSATKAERKRADKAIFSGNGTLGTIGGGNHFAEIQRVKEVFNQEEFAQVGLDAQSVVLLAHSGSRGLGQFILRQHVDEYGGQGLEAGHHCASQTENYIDKHNYAVAWASENRNLIAARFCHRLGVKRSALLDVPHNTVTELDSDNAVVLGFSTNKNERYWIHRKGASPTDQGLVMIPGSRGSLSYLVKPKANDFATLAQGGFSLAHGAGRKWKRSDVRGRLDKRFTAKDLLVTSLGSRVICGKRDLLFEEAPQAYKDIDLVIADLCSAGMIDVIASFQPMITYKTRRQS